MIAGGRGGGVALRPGQAVGRAKAAAPSLAYQQGCITSKCAPIALRYSHGLGRGQQRRSLRGMLQLQPCCASATQAQERSFMAGLTVGAQEARCVEGMETLKRAQVSQVVVWKRQAGKARRLKTTASPFSLAEAVDAAACVPLA